jgi:hypothetical protein
VRMNVLIVLPEAVDPAARRRRGRAALAATQPLAPLPAGAAR